MKPNLPANAQGGIHPDVVAAETYAWRQRKAGGQFLRLKKSKGLSPADLALAERVVDAAKNDFGEFENLITFPAVNALFVRGILFYKVR